MDRLFTAEEIADLIRVEVTTIQKWAREGKIPVLRLSVKIHRFVPADVIAALKATENHSPCPH